MPIKHNRFQPLCEPTVFDRMIFRWILYTTSRYGCYYEFSDNVHGKAIGKSRGKAHKGRKLKSRPTDNVVSKTIRKPAVN
jgi:hypothetical protein